MLTSEKTAEHSSLTISYTSFIKLKSIVLSILCLESYKLVFTSMSSSPLCLPISFSPSSLSLSVSLFLFRSLSLPPSAPPSLSPSLSVSPPLSFCLSLFLLLEVKYERRKGGRKVAPCTRKNQFNAALSLQRVQHRDLH